MIVPLPPQLLTDPDAPQMTIVSPAVLPPSTATAPLTVALAATEPDPLLATVTTVLPIVLATMTAPDVTRQTAVTVTASVIPIVVAVRVAPHPAAQEPQSPLMMSVTDAPYLCSSWLPAFVPMSSSSSSPRSAPSRTLRSSRIASVVVPRGKLPFPLLPLTLLTSFPQCWLR